MKVALITDTHFGARGDNVVFDNFFKQFYDNIFFPELEKRQIKNIIHLGDTFDRRKYINFNSLHSCRKYFFDKIQGKYEVKMLIGNHDTFYKNTNETNSPELLLKEYNSITTYSEPIEVMLDGKKILFLPWICPDNWGKANDMLDNSDAEAAFGHLEIAGCTMFKGQTNYEGLDPKRFHRFKLACSGHYHHRHSIGNITYLGNPYEMFWNDFEDQRGFNILDTEDWSLEFIPNPYTMFKKIYYNEDKQLPKASDFTDKIVKVIVVNRKDVSKYETYMDNLYAASPIEVKIIEDFSEFEADVLDDDTLDLSDTLTLVSQYVDNLDTDADKKRLNNLMKSLYIEAQDYDTI